MDEQGCRVMAAFLLVHESSKRFLFDALIFCLLDY
jgi:hypothetical protein